MAGRAGWCIYRLDVDARNVLDDVWATGGVGLARRRRVEVVVVVLGRGGSSVGHLESLGRSSSSRWALCDEYTLTTLARGGGQTLAVDVDA